MTTFDENYFLFDPTSFSISKDRKIFTISSNPREIISFSNDSLVVFWPSRFTIWAGSNGSGSGSFPCIEKFEHYPAYEKTININDNTSNVYKLLTTSYWKKDIEKVYIDGIYQYSTNLTSDQKNVRYFFHNDGVFTGYLNEKIVWGPHRWYLIDNNSKIRMGGSIPSRIYEITYLDDSKFTMKNTQPFADNKNRFITYEIFYIKN